MTDLKPMQPNNLVSKAKTTYHIDKLNGWFYRVFRHVYTTEIAVCTKVYIAVVKPSITTVICLYNGNAKDVENTSFYKKILPQWRAFTQLAKEPLYELVFTVDSGVDLKILNKLINGKHIDMAEWETLRKVGKAYNHNVME